MKTTVAPFLSTWALSLCGPLFLSTTVVVSAANNIIDTDVIDVFAGLPDELVADDVSEQVPIPRIFDGTVVTNPDEIPAFALLCFNGATVCNGCGGSLISPNKVLTAAHCITTDFSPTAVRIGALTNTGGDFVAIEAIAVHPDFENVDGTNFLINDVAVLTLSTNVSTTPLNFNRDTSVPSDTVGLPVTAYGFGGIDADETQSSVLRTADFNTIPLAQCRGVQGPNIDPTQHICTLNANEGICAGDSGGPIVGAARTTVLGISSFGEEGCARGAVDVWTDVAHYADWIDEQLTGTPPPTMAPVTLPTMAPVAVPTMAPVMVPTTTVAPVVTLAPIPEVPTTMGPTTESAPGYRPPRGAATTGLGRGLDAAYVSVGGAAVSFGGRTGRRPVVQSPTPRPTPRPTLDDGLPMEPTNPESATRVSGRVQIEFGFYDGTTLRVPTSEEYLGLLSQTRRFFRTVLRDAFPGFVSFEALLVEQMLTPTNADLPLVVVLDVTAFFVPGSRIPSVAQVLYVLENANRFDYIVNYVHQAFPTDGIMAQDAALAIFSVPPL